MRQESLGKEEEPRTRKPFVGTLRVINPVRQSLASSRKRVLRGVGVTRTAKRRQRVPKAVLIEPRNDISREPTSFDSAEAASRHRNGLATRSRRGRRTGHGHGGSPGTWETLSLPSAMSRLGIPEDQLPGPRPAHSRPREQRPGATVVPPSEGNEARRDGR